MRAIVQRVSSASVTVDNEVVSRIAHGLMVLVGIGSDDTDADVATLSKKILTLRVFSDPINPQNMWKANVKDIDGDILCVSQFTLLANTSKGNKPDFHNAMATEPSRQLYSRFLEVLRHSYKAEKIQGALTLAQGVSSSSHQSGADGVFGAMMSVNLTNEGPVTFTLDTRKFEYIDTPNSNKNVKKKVDTPPALTGEEGLNSP